MQREESDAQILHLNLGPYVDAEAYMLSGKYPRKENNGKLPGWGYNPGMSESEAFNLNRWDWNVSLNRSPRFVIFSYDGTVRFAAEITDIRLIPTSKTAKKELQGRVLEHSHPVYIEYVNRRTPEWAKGRGPRYFYDNTATVKM